MTIFQAALQNSAFLRPLVRLAQMRSSDLDSFWQESLPGKFFWTTNQLFSLGKGGNRDTFLSAVFRVLFHPHLLTLGLVALLMIMAVMQTTPIALMVIGLLIFSRIAAWVAGENFLKGLSVFDILVCLFFVSVAISAGFSSYNKEALVGLLKMSVFFASYLVFRHAFSRNTGILLIVLWALSLLGLGEALVGFYQHSHQVNALATWQDPTTLSELRMTRIFGTLQPSNPNLLAGFLLPCLASAGGLALYYLSKGLKTHWQCILFHTFSALAILIATVLTGSRGGFLALGAMGLVTFMYSGHLIFNQAELKSRPLLKGLWLGILTFSVLGIAYALGTSEKLQHRVLSIFAMRNDSSISYRLNVYESAWTMFQHNWLLGIGPGSSVFKQVYGMYMVPGYNALSSYSVPLEIAVEQGVIGLLSFWALLSTLKVRVLLHVDSRVPLPQKILVGLLFTAIVGSVTYGLFDTIWYRPSVNILFWLMLAGLVVQSELMFKENVLKTKA